MKDYRYIADYVKRIQSEHGSLALTRLGDGEARILNSNNSLHDANFSIKRHLGENMSYNRVMQIRKSLMKAFNGSDIIGVPTNKHKKEYGGDKYWHKAEQMMTDLLPKTKDIMKCSIDIHTDWLANDVYRELLQDQKDVYVVNCRDVGSALEEKYNIGRVHQFFIDPQMKYEIQKRMSNHFPVQFMGVYEWINGLKLNGEICLVGAGFVGKIYSIWFKDAGGIGLDIGHVFDRWVGMATRGVGGKVGITSDKYKL